MWIEVELNYNNSNTGFSFLKMCAYFWHPLCTDNIFSLQLYYVVVLQRFVHFLSQQ